MMAGDIIVRLQLTALPADLLLRVYEVLSSLADALRLHATCHTLHDVWTDHRTAIVNEIVVNQFECYPQARQLLARQPPGVPLEQRDLSDNNLSNLLQNAQRVEQVIVDIEQRFIPRLKMDDTTYGGSNTHDATLTQTERLRVIRTCYLIWTLCLSPSDVVHAKILSLRPRELFYLFELAHWARVTKFPTQDKWETYHVVMSAGHRLQMLYHKTYRCEAPKFQGLVSYEGPEALFVIWDHWQDNLKNLICRRPLSNLRWDVQAQMLEHLWDYEPGDELLIV
ncbi:hypothetical protein K504DRAFT_480442 [Pleomassaria siparia CBS 279.74]|uniref:F-box domain-containing protein n=1 Tax=Pleomassaria siparia CBS 279.74 TaxID=1314801 RepID=A0A6G1KFZ0_9PLEO|nr:hypothetical protein K504DRAFT_480442 [Pleomassaria siparia CBS 279.74]